MKKILYLAFAINLNVLNAESMEEKLFIEANNYMVIQKYSEAILLYEKILDMGFQSSELFYNLGNAFYRNNDIGLSIWAYLSSLKLKPRFEDAARNLTIAQSNTKDKVELPKNIYIFDNYKRLKSMLTFYELVFIGGLISLTFSVISFMIKVQYFQIEQLFNFNKIIIFIYLLIIIITIDKYYTDNINKGVVITNSVEAFSGPDYGQNKVIFLVNEGVTFNISNKKNNWFEIILIDGSKGWIESKSARVI
jgi:tetratricopeptide (TPR) repeat protein